MDKIYLASRSKARKKVLKDLGFSFKVIVPVVKERKKRGKLSFAQLVKANALAKAEDAASRVTSGLIIACDTITVQDNRIFGKPSSIKEARRMLKQLSSKPQTVYSGIAVIDKKNSLSRTASEKTIVYMKKLKPEDIEAYFKKVSPLDKAGGFDIQGRGAFFIRRIEGCFYNVVGLPVHKLYGILRQLNIKVFFLLILFLGSISGCSTEYNIVTGKEEKYYYSSDREVQLGRAIDKAIEKEEKMAEDPLLQKRVEDIGKRIAAVSDRKEIDYHFKVLDDDEVNAVSLPGGYVYINKGLLEKAKSDDELAGVIAHEVGHIVARHSIKKLQALQGFSLLRILVAQAPTGSAEVGTAADAAFVELLLGYGREDELLADQLGTRYSKLAGFDPHGMIRFLNKLQDINRRKPLTGYSYYKTHPYIPDRIRIVRQELGESVRFSDYINTEQKTHGQE